MSEFKSITILCCLLSCFDYITSISSTGDNYSLTIDLSANDKSNKTSQVFENYLNFTRNMCNLNIEVVNVPPKANGSFFVIQFHSFKANFSLANEQNEVVSGRNTGLVQVNLQQDVKYRYHLKCAQELSDDVKVLLVLVLYEKEDPVPGGCNLTFQPEISAYQNITYNNNVVQVDVQVASVYNLPCENNSVEIEMYHLYMRESALDENEYFQSVEKMLTYEDIISNANKVAQPDGVMLGRRYYSAYLGTGTVYGVVAKYKDRTSAYIPVVSYACDTDNWDEDCIAPTTTVWKVIIAILLFLGLFTLFLGHTFFTIQLFTVGLVLGFFVGSIISGLAGFSTDWQSFSVSVTCGALLGVAWSCFWCRWGVPLISASLSVLFVGYITCCIIYYSAAGDTEFIRRNLNYWGIIVSVIIVFSVLLVHTQFSHILACSFLGASAVTVSINHYVGGNLHYVFLNNIRRATVTGFNKAVIDPVFQYNDVLLSVMWFFLLVTGNIVQFKLSRGKPPFPPPRQGTQLLFSNHVFRRLRRTSNAHINERTPLLN